ncbi:MAG TPA: hypothetical protein PL048_00465 [Leptospiraceae bacterium]|nr:hypothetical protein [Leptospiraceae bacterium]HMZ57215.1 hypothetical protein [Leptospiraceae bacterium]HNF16718.1 hypothetical protein [Leptospiraceae bacterium]HNF23124.1 hypothetical protein [Leptospiraceae bacterium]HNI98284.1 hypothetical protein [Leptospiraceae bacterium]
MKVIHLEVLIEKGEFAESEDWEFIKNEIIKEVKEVDWPHGSGKFTIYPESGKKRGMGNGVKPIKDTFVKRLVTKGWESERPLDIASRKKPGNLDLLLDYKGKKIAIEWETGNISSTHRALNKMALGLVKNILSAGVLVLPSRELYRYLTDRIGNFDEIEPYIELWKSLNLNSGILIIIVIEHDEESIEVKKIPKGTDGRALN